MRKNRQISVQPKPGGINGAQEAAQRHMLHAILHAAQFTIPAPSPAPRFAPTRTKLAPCMTIHAARAETRLRKRSVISRFANLLPSATDSRNRWTPVSLAANRQKLSSVGRAVCVVQYVCHEWHQAGLTNAPSPRNTDMAAECVTRHAANALGPPTSVQARQEKAHRG